MGPQHVMNMQFCRIGKKFYATCVALSGGCFVAAGMMTLIMSEMHSAGLSYMVVFTLWASLRLFILIVRLVFLTPKSIPGESQT